MFIKFTLRKTFFLGIVMLPLLSLWGAEKKEVTIHVKEIGSNVFKNKMLEVSIPEPEDMYDIDYELEDYDGIKVEALQASIQKQLRKENLNEAIRQACYPYVPPECIVKEQKNEGEDILQSYAIWNAYLDDEEPKVYVSFRPLLTLAPKRPKNAELALNVLLDKPIERKEDLKEKLPKDFKNVKFQVCKKGQFIDLEKVKNITEYLYHGKQLPLFYSKIIHLILPSKKTLTLDTSTLYEESIKNLRAFVQKNDPSLKISKKIRFYENEKKIQTKELNESYLSTTYQVTYSALAEIERNGSIYSIHVNDELGKDIEDFKKKLTKLTTKDRKNFNINNLFFKRTKLKSEKYYYLKLTKNFSAIEEATYAKFLYLEEEQLKDKKFPFEDNKNLFAEALPKLYLKVGNDVLSEVEGNGGFFYKWDDLRDHLITNKLAGEHQKPHIFFIDEEEELGNDGLKIAEDTTVEVKYGKKIEIIMDNNAKKIVYLPLNKKNKLDFLKDALQKEGYHITTLLAKEEEGRYHALEEKELTGNFSKKTIYLNKTFKINLEEDGEVPLGMLNSFDQKEIGKLVINHLKENGKRQDYWKKVHEAGKKVFFKKENGDAGLSWEQAKPIRHIEAKYKIDIVRGIYEKESIRLDDDYKVNTIRKSAERGSEVVISKKYPDWAITLPVERFNQQTLENLKIKKKLDSYDYIDLHYNRLSPPLHFYTDKLKLEDLKAALEKKVNQGEWIVLKYKKDGKFHNLDVDNLPSIEEMNPPYIGVNILENSADWKSVWYTGDGPQIVYDKNFKKRDVQHLTLQCDSVTQSLVYRKKDIGKDDHIEWDIEEVMKAILKPKVKKEETVPLLLAYEDDSVWKPFNLSDYATLKEKDHLKVKLEIVKGCFLYEGKTSYTVSYIEKERLTPWAPDTIKQGQIDMAPLNNSGGTTTYQFIVDEAYSYQALADAVKAEAKKVYKLEKYDKALDGWLFYKKDYSGLIEPLNRNTQTLMGDAFYYGPRTDTMQFADSVIELYFHLPPTFWRYFFHFGRSQGLGLGHVKFTGQKQEVLKKVNNYLKIQLKSDTYEWYASGDLTENLSYQEAIGKMKVLTGTPMLQIENDEPYVNISAFVKTKNEVITEAALPAPIFIQLSWAFIAFIVIGVPLFLRFGWQALRKRIKGKPNLNTLAQKKKQEALKKKKEKEKEEKTEKKEEVEEVTEVKKVPKKRRRRKGRKR